MAIGQGLHGVHWLSEKREKSFKRGEKRACWETWNRNTVGHWLTREAGQRSLKRG
jgi:hypothetical protein